MSPSLTQPVRMEDFSLVVANAAPPDANVDGSSFCVEQARHPAQDLPPVSLPASPTGEFKSKELLLTGSHASVRC